MTSPAEPYGQGTGLTRRVVLTVAGTFGTAAMTAATMPATAQGGGQPRAATAITEVFGDGARLTAIAVEYDEPINGNALGFNAFQVVGRTVTGAYPSTSADPADRVASGRFVIVTLSPDDANAPIARRAERPRDAASPNAPDKHGGPGQAGDVPPYDTTYPPPSAVVIQTAPLRMADGSSVAAAAPIPTHAVENRVVDSFVQRVFHDPATGKTLRYNLYVPQDHDPKRPYPLVLFMHDAGATSNVTRTTLFQGLGAVVWAKPTDQAKRPCFVLAPQYEEIIADDDSRTSNAMPATVNLIEELRREYRIDGDRLYTTGQSGGCMMSIAMMIAYPDLFAAAFLVAGQWDPKLVLPLASKKLWIVVSQDDDKAYPGMNAITATLEQHGARVSRAVWDGRSSDAAFRTAYETMAAEQCPINSVSFAKGTVVPAGESMAGASGHRNTWRIAYGIEPIREWVFAQKR